MLQTKGLNAVNRKQFRDALLNKGEALIDAENEFISPDISLVRPSEKIVWDGTSFETVPANEPAWHVDFETGEKVLLVEGEATNLIPSQSAGGIDGATGVTLTTYNAMGLKGVQYVGTGAATKFLGISTFQGNSDYTLSCIVDFSYPEAYGQFGLYFSQESYPVRTRLFLNKAGEIDFENAPGLNNYKIIEILPSVFFVTATATTKSSQSGSAAHVGVRSLVSTNVRIYGCTYVQTDKPSSLISVSGSAVTRAADTITYTGDPITTTQILETSSGTVATDSGLPLNTQEAAIRKLAKLPITLTELGSNRFNSGLDEEDYFEEIAP